MRGFGPCTDPAVIISYTTAAELKAPVCFYVLVPVVVRLVMRISRLEFEARLECCIMVHIIGKGSEHKEKSIRRTWWTDGSP
jgi:hypothetical protein